MVPVLRLESTKVNALLHEIAQRSDDLSRPLSSCGEVMRTSIDRNFEVGGRYSSAGSVRGGSNRWVDLAQSTKQQRGGAYKILQGSGHLATSFVYEVAGNTLIVGTSVEYAAIHHFGGKTKAHKIKPTYKKALSFVGSGGNRVTVKSVNHPGSDIPERPILVVQDEDVDEMLDILGKYIMK